MAGPWRRRFFVAGAFFAAVLAGALVAGAFFAAVFLAGAFVVAVFAAPSSRAPSSPAPSSRWPSWSAPSWRAPSSRGPSWRSAPSWRAPSSRAPSSRAPSWPRPSSSRPRFVGRRSSSRRPRGRRPPSGHRASPRPPSAGQLACCRACHGPRPPQPCVHQGTCDHATCAAGHTRAARICRTRTQTTNRAHDSVTFRDAARPRAANPGEPARRGLADLAAPHGVDGTSSSEDSRQRPGDGESPGVLSGAKITPEPPEERPTHPGPAGRPGSGAHEWAVQQHRAAKEGGTAGAAGGDGADRPRPFSPAVPSRSEHEGPAVSDVPPRPTPGGPPRPRARGARASGADKTFDKSLGAGRRPPALDLLRGPADRERPPRHPPRRGPRLQGRVPALQDHAGLPRRAEGRLGLPRPARSSSRSRRSSASPARATSRRTASRSSTPGAASRCCGTSTPSRR